MNESGDQQQQQQQQQRVGSSVNPKIASDSGYGSNKSTQRSSGSSKSHESSVSSESSTAYPPHPNAVSITECQSHSTSASPSQGASTKRQGKKKKSDRKLSVGEKVDIRLTTETTKDSNKSGNLNQTIDQSGNNSGNVANTPSGSQQQISQSQIMSPGSKASSTHDSKALQMAALTHALSCMKKFHKPIQDSEINEGNDEIGTVPGENWQEYLSNDIQVDGSNEDTFATVVSLDDGIVVYITPTISDILGFPKDMLVGRSFIDFVHPKDRMAFASHITCGMSFPMGEQQQSQGPNSNVNNSGAAKVKSEPFYCRLRQYRGLKTVGFGVVDKSINYYPFKLTMTLKKVEPGQKDSGVGMGTCATSAPTSANYLDDSSYRQVIGTDEENSNNVSSPASILVNGSDSGASPASAGISSKKSNFAYTPNTTVHLVIVANRIKSAYTYPDEIPVNPAKFVTRHSASCHYGHMDSDAINYLGHLPQDLIGNSVLDYYHPEDMGLMKDIYDGVMQEQGKPFRSKPYRFRVYNGTFAMLETDWSCFINPWSWKLEFVIGQHRVIKGPGNPNVFMQPTNEDDCKKNMPDEILDASRDFQGEIKRLLTEVRKRANKTVTRRLSDPLRQQSSRRRKDLAALMESLLEGMAKTENSDKSGSQCSGMFSVMERDSVMLGEISPHHDDQSGSNQSSETPPSYNQLNYRENIERFFQSQPKTVRSNESEESSKMETSQSANRSSDSDSKGSPNIDYSSGSNIRLSSGSGSNDNESGDRDLCASPLTEERLSRHNEEMEKYMIQRHRELRGKSSMTPGSHKESRHRHSEKPETAHGIKRTGNASWDGDAHTAKQPHLDGLPGRNPNLAPTAAPGACCSGHNTINLWPPFSITMTPGITTPTYRSAGAAEASASCMPTNYPGMTPCFNTNRPVGQTSASSGNRIPEAISMSATTPSAAPLLFLPSQHPHQFVPQQDDDDDGHSRDWNEISEIVQLFPAGVVYQPLGSCIYGQPSPIMMPAGFLGTMINPGDQSVMNQLESSSAQIGRASQGEALGTATLPKVSEVDKAGPCSGAKRMSNMMSGCGKGKHHLTSTPVSAGHYSSTGPSKHYGTKGHQMSRSSLQTHPLQLINKSGIVTSAMKPNVTSVSSSGCRHLRTSVGRDGSGSDESMNSGSINTKDLLDDDKESQSNSDQDVPIWATRGRDDGGGGQNFGNFGGEFAPANSSNPKPTRDKQPPWLEKVKMTPDLMYRYRVPAGDMSDVLQKDLEALKIFGKQSSMVNDQLNMLYGELNFGGNNSEITLNLEEGTTSNSSGEENAKDSREPIKTKKPVSSHQYSKMVILYEENSPFPPESDAVGLPKHEAEG